MSEVIEKNQRLNLRLRDLVAQQRQTTYEILQFIIEIERRKLYLANGCNSTVEMLKMKWNFRDDEALIHFDAAMTLGRVPNPDQAFLDAVIGRV